MASKHLILVLDESGSMLSQQRDVISGINSLLEEQRKNFTPAECAEIKVDVVKFSEIVKQLEIAQTLSNIRDFTVADYVPSGGTALFDALGTVIKQYAAEDNVVLVVATDGKENASRHYNFKTAVSMIAEQREKHNWSVVYLCEGLDAFEQGATMGLGNNASGVTKDARGVDCYNKNYNVCVQRNAVGSAIDSCKTGVTRLMKGDRTDFGYMTPSQAEAPQHAASLAAPPVPTKKSTVVVSKPSEPLPASFATVPKPVKKPADTKRSSNFFASSPSSYSK